MQIKSRFHKCILTNKHICVRFLTKEHFSNSLRKITCTKKLSERVQMSKFSTGGLSPKVHLSTKHQLSLPIEAKVQMIPLFFVTSSNGVKLNSISSKSAGLTSTIEEKVCAKFSALGPNKSPLLPKAMPGWINRSHYNHKTILYDKKMP